VEGAQASKHHRRESDDGIRRFINTAIQISSGNAHHSDAMFLEPSIAAFVVLRSIAQIVADPVDLNREMGLSTVEVEHVGTDWMLAAKDGLAWKTSTQTAP
jgi:hypothetical protein